MTRRIQILVPDEVYDAVAAAAKDDLRSISNFLSHYLSENFSHPAVGHSAKRSGMAFGSRARPLDDVLAELDDD